MPAPLLGWLATGLLLFGLTGSVITESTDIPVRVIARNAMFVGDLVEGAQVTVTDAVTGEMLAQGVTAGQAGDAKRIMGTARKRGTPVAGETDAHFTATLELDEPRYVQVTAFGPLPRRQSATRPSMTQWIVPGRHLTGGDGWVVELAGFFVHGDLAANTVSLAEAGAGSGGRSGGRPDVRMPGRAGLLLERRQLRSGGARETRRNAPWSISSAIRRHQQ